ncbi:MAG: TetR/AcrR family transcriptional regulator [Gammaproteobacteria bacterium]
MTEKKKFHHGNLRQELIEAGHAALNESGVDGISLRKLAQRAGVSQSAPYRHFKSKEALLQELIDGGLDELNTAYETAANLTASPSEKLKVACNDYLDFAVNRSGLFQLIFESDGSFSATSVKSSDDAPSFILFVKMVADVTPAVPKGKELDAATLCWSIIHGFASLYSHDEIPEKVNDVWLRNSVIEAAIKSVSEHEWV